MYPLNEIPTLVNCNGTIVTIYDLDDAIDLVSCHLGNEMAHVLATLIEIERPSDEELNDLRYEIDELESECDEYADDNDSLEREVERLTDKIEALEEKIKELEKKNGEQL